MAKKYLLGAAAAFAACSGGGATPSNIDLTKYTTVTLDELATQANERLVVNTSAHHAATVIREPLLPVASNTSMYREVASIQEVKNYATGVTVPASQYSVVDGKVQLGAGYTLLASNWASTPSGDAGTDAASYRKDGSRIRVTSTYATSYLTKQLLVTYTPASAWDYFDKPSLLPRFTRLINQQAITGITFIGDSITAGADSSFNFSLQPVQRYWANLLTGFFTDKNPNVKYRNVAVAGQTSAYGAANAAVDLAPKTDLLVIAYGMNDQAAELSKADFKTNLKTMMDVAKSNNPSVEFLLVSGMRPEITWVYARDWYLNVYREAMHEIATEYSAGGNKTVVVDVTSEYDRYVQRKGFQHTTGTGVNHPCDFGHVLYTQVILHRLGFFN